MNFFYIFTTVVFIVSLYLRFSRKKDDVMISLKRKWAYVITPIYQISLLMAISNSITAAAELINLDKVLPFIVSIFWVVIIIIFFVFCILPKTKNYFKYLYNEPFISMDNNENQEIISILELVYKSGFSTLIITIIFLIVVIIQSIIIFSTGFMLTLFVLPVFILGFVASVVFTVGLCFFILSFIINYLMVLINTKKLIKLLADSDAIGKKYKAKLAVPFYQLTIVKRILYELKKDSNRIEVIL